MQIFLRNSTTECDKALSIFIKVDPMELVYRYNLHFKDLKTEKDNKNV
jgi:hypothetical protein